MVAFVTLYHKGFSASQEQKCVHRFVPQEVGELVVYYLWLLQGSRAQVVFGPWLWEPAPEEEWQEEEEEWGEVDETTAAESVPDVPDDSAEAQFIERRTESKVCLSYDGFWETNRIRRVMRRGHWDQRLATGVSRHPPGVCHPPGHHRNVGPHLRQR